MDQHTYGLNWLRLNQLADSALPIGAAAHSFGLESLVEDGALKVENLMPLLHDYLLETGTLESAYCRAAHAIVPPTPNPSPVKREGLKNGISPSPRKEGKGQGIGGVEPTSTIVTWLELNMRLDALKTVRESRAASTALGRRFLQLALDLVDAGEQPALLMAQQTAKQNGIGIHHCTAFGLVGGVLQLDANVVALAYLQQTLTGLVSACQRLLPLGQTAASQILWNLKPTIVDAVYKESTALEEVAAFTPMIDVGSLRHPVLSTRLFIS